VGFAKIQPEGAEEVEARIHARQHRQMELGRGRHLAMAVSIDVRALWATSSSSRSSDNCRKHAHARNAHGYRNVTSLSLEFKIQSPKLERCPKIARRRRCECTEAGRQLEVMTLGWNVVGVFILAFAAVAARSVALAGFGWTALIEIGASTVVLWELAEVTQIRQRRAMRIIGSAFVALAIYLRRAKHDRPRRGLRPHHSSIGIA